MMMRRGFSGIRLAVRIGWVAVGCLALVIAGCGRGGPERVAISGKVSYHGEPVKSGEIRFIPSQDTGGPAWGALIVDGQYVADGNGGVPVGTHRVEISAPGAKGAAGGDREFGAPSSRNAKTASQKQYLPAKYNSQSTLKITVEPGSRRIVKDFALTD
jgi:hypothetical protein